MSDAPKIILFCAATLLLQSWQREKNTYLAGAGSQFDWTGHVEFWSQDAAEHYLRAHREQSTPQRFLSVERHNTWGLRWWYPDTDTSMFYWIQAAGKAGPGCGRYLLEQWQTLQSQRAHGAAHVRTVFVLLNRLAFRENDLGLLHDIGDAYWEWLGERNEPAVTHIAELLMAMLAHPAELYWFLQHHTATRDKVSAHTNALSSIVLSKRQDVLALQYAQVVRALGMRIEPVDARWSLHHFLDDLIVAFEGDTVAQWLAARQCIARHGVHIPLMLTHCVENPHYKPELKVYFLARCDAEGISVKPEWSAPSPTREWVRMAEVLGLDDVSFCSEARQFLRQKNTERGACRLPEGSMSSAVE